SITISCDGRFVAEASYGLRRPDVARLGVPGGYKAGFSCHVDTRTFSPGMHQLTVTARSRDGRTASISRSVRINPQPSDYDRWRQQNRVTPAALSWMRRNSSCFAFRPRVSLAMTVLTCPDACLLAGTLRSLTEQAYSDWELCIACDRQFGAELDQALADLQIADDRAQVEYVQCCNVDEARNLLLRRASGELFGLLDVGDVLEPAALFEFVYYWNRHAQSDIVYSDEDSIGEMDACNSPFFKPDWSPDLLLAFNYIGRFWLARRSLLAEAGGFRAFSDSASEHDLLLRLTENAKVIGHIQTVLYGRRRTDAAACESERDVRRVLEDTMQRRPLEGEVLPDGVPGTCRVKRALNDPGLVSLIVAVTRDASEFRKCIESIRNKTSYGDIEIIVPYCDRAVDKSLRRFFRSAGVKGIKCEHSANISQLMNAGAEIAKGKYL